MPAKVLTPSFLNASPDGFLSIQNAPPAPPAPPADKLVTTLNSVLGNPAVQNFLMAGAKLIAVKAEMMKNEQQKPKAGKLTAIDNTGKEVELPTPVFGDTYRVI